MGKDFLRIDDRLIHGQIVMAWCKALGIKEIVDIDRSDPLLVIKVITNSETFEIIQKVMTKYLCGSFYLYIGRQKIV